MYELIILGFLMRSISHGYRISKIINDMIGPYAKMSPGRIYPLFNKLKKEGLINLVQGEGDTRHREYTISEKGRERFRQLMMDTTSNPGEYRKLFAFKVVFIDLVQLNEQVYLFDHFINYCQTHIFHIDAELEDLKRREAEMGNRVWSALAMMAHLKSQWKMELEWATKIRNEIKQKEE
jgi:DNA-binding PadR family transcriptional regulator